MHGTKTMWEQEGTAGSLLSSVCTQLTIGAPDRTMEGGNKVDPLGAAYVGSTLEVLRKM